MAFTSHPLTIRISAWIAGRDGVEPGDLRLDRKRVYIVPTRAGFMFALAMLALLLGSINYALQLGFMLTFLVTSMAVVGMHSTHRNLHGILIRGQKVEPVFAGDLASFEFVTTNPTSEARYALRFSYVPGLSLKLKAQAPRAPMGSTVKVSADVAANGARTIVVPLPALTRGRLACPRLTIETVYPFGLFRAWSYLRAPLSAVVYPLPELDAPPLPLTGEGGGTRNGPAASGDDFAGVRPYQPGDAQKLIAWRLAAHSDDLSVKLFDASGGGELMLDYAELPGFLSVEEKLSRLTRWLLDAEAVQLRYGLRLPSTNVALGTGAVHRERCLTALALFESEPRGGKR